MAFGGGPAQKRLVELEVSKGGAPPAASSSWSHAEPDVGADHIGIDDGHLGIVGDADSRRARRLVALGRSDRELELEEVRRLDPGKGHVAGPIAHERHPPAFEASKALLDGHEVGEQLNGMGPFR